jgi:hypothetical protein
MFVDDISSAGRDKFGSQVSVSIRLFGLLLGCIGCSSAPLTEMNVACDTHSATYLASKCSHRRTFLGTLNQPRKSRDLPHASLSNNLCDPMYYNLAICRAPLSCCASGARLAGGMMT